MKKILLVLFFVFGLVSFFSFGPTASATGFEDVDWTVPMTSQTQARLRIGVANFSKVWAYKATMTNGEVTGLSLVCQYASSSNGVNPIVKECLTTINNDNTNLVLVAFSNNANAGVIADLLPGSGGVFALSDDVQYPRIISASVLAAGASPTIAQLIPEVNYGFPSLPQAPIAQNGDSGWNYIPLSPDSAWMGVGLPVPAEEGHYIIKLVKNAGAGGSSGVPTLDFKANGQTSVTLAALPSSTTPVNLTWGATGVSSCIASTTANPTNSSASTIWNGTKGASGTFAITNLSPVTVYTFKLDCSDAGGNHVIKTVTVSTPLAPASVSFASASVTAQVNTPATLSWTPSNAGTCTIASVGTPAGVAGTTTGNSWSGTFTAIGTYTYKVTCVATGGSLPANPEATATVTVTAAPVPTVTISASPTTIQVGGTSVITWSSTNSTTCTKTGGVTGWTVGTGTSGTFTTPALNTVGTTSFDISCTGLGGTTAVSSALVTVTASPQNPTVTISASPTSVQANSTGTNGTSVITWSSTDAAICTKIGGSTGWTSAPGDTSGSWTTALFNTAGDYTYTITCNGVSGTTPATASVTINVSATVLPPTVNLTAFSSNVQVGEETTLTWSSFSVNTCTKSASTSPTNIAFPSDWITAPGNSSGLLGGWATGVFTIPGVYTYTIICTNSSGMSATDSVSITVTNAPVASVDLSVSNTSVQIGDSATLTWDLANVGTCASVSTPTGWATPTIVNGNSTGSWVIPTPAVMTYTFSISCTPVSGATIGNLTDTVTISVQATAVAPVVTIVAAPNPVDIGDSSFIDWTSTGDITICTKTGPNSWVAVVPNNGSNFQTGSLSSAGTRTYTFSCTGPGGTDTESVTVTWKQKALLPTVSVTASPAKISLNGESKITWSSNNATSCTKTVTTPLVSSSPVSLNGLNGEFMTGTLSTLGIYTYTITCVNINGDATSASASVLVKGISTPVAPTVTISAAPNPVQINQSSILTWSSVGEITSCNKSGPATWVGTPGNNGTWETGKLTAPGTRTYTFSCTGPGGTDTESVTVTWKQKALLPTVSVTASPNKVPVNGQSMITWSANNAISCTKAVSTPLISSIPSPLSGLSGQFSTGILSTSGTHTYTITCVNINGDDASASASVLVKNAGAPSVVVKINGSSLKNIVSTNPSANLTWDSQNTSTCNGTQTVTVNGLSSTTTNPVPLNGNQNINLLAGKTYDFKVVCTGTNGAIVSDYVTVRLAQLPTVDIKVQVGTNPPFNGPAKATSSSAVKLSWSSTNATTCQASTTKSKKNLSNPWTGKKAPNGTSANLVGLTALIDYTFSITCLGPDGSANDSVVVSVKS